MKPKNLGELDKETVDRNFLTEEPDVDLNKIVHPYSASMPIPQFRWITFMNNRDPGTTLHFHYASQNHPLRHYDLVHGQNYNLPEEVIRHLEGNNDIDQWSCHKRLYGRRMKSDGVTEVFVNGYTPYFQCKQARAA
jgi:hypothetical protein